MCVGEGGVGARYTIGLKGEHDDIKIWQNKAIKCNLEGAPTAR